MKYKDNPPIINEYVTNVCSQVRAYEMHPDIRTELENHILELADDLQTNSPNLTYEEALKAAITQMGDPKMVGTRLDRIHRPRTDWSLVTVIVILLSMALITMYSAEKSLLFRSSVHPFELFDKKIIFVAIGLIFLVGVRLIDYRKIKNLSNVIYWSMLVLMIVTMQFGLTVNGIQNYLSLFGFRIPIMSLSPYVLIIALCGLLFKEENNHHPWKQWATYVFPPMVLFMLNPDFTLMLFYFIAAFVLFAAAYKSWLFRILVPITHFVLILLFIFFKPSHSSLKSRLASYLDSYSDPQGAGYMAVQSSKIIREAGWLGQGIGTPNSVLPNLHSDAIYTYIIFSFGWLGGLVLVWTVLALMFRIIVTARKVKDDYGKQIIIVLGLFLSMKFIWSIGMALGWLPWTSVQLPFLSFGGSDLIADMMAVGLIMGIYRRKDIIRLSSQPSSYRIN